MKTVLSIAALLFAATTLRADPNPKPATIPDAAALALTGLTLSPQEVEKLEAEVAAHPDDLDDRVRLLGYYSTSRNTLPVSKEKSRAHILWIIKNHPESEIVGEPICQINKLTDHAGYTEATKAWLEQIRTHRNDAKVLGHAGEFFSLNDYDIAEKLFQQTEQLEPKNPEWHDRLAHLYRNAARGNPANAKTALAEFEKAQSLDKDAGSKDARLVYLARTAFEAGDFTKATNYANAMLAAASANPKGPNSGNAIHHGNIVLGRIALQKGNVKKANEYLLKAADTPGSRELASFGPDMMLAKLLLKKGQKAAVLKYLYLCRMFWKYGDDHLEDWKTQITAGRVPDFGPNLYF